MNILIDADALVALVKEDDANHRKAVKIAQKIKKDSLFISPLTIPEAASVISHRVSQPAAKVFLKEARKRKLAVISLNAELEEKADEVFLDQKTKGTSWPDCLNIAIAKKYAIEAIFSFDKVYSKSGLRVLG